MDLDELLAFKPQKKRSLVEDDIKEDEKPPSSKRRGEVGGGTGAKNGTSSEGLGSGARGLAQLNGASEEEKLKILQSLDVDEDDTGMEVVCVYVVILPSLKCAKVEGHAVLCICCCHVVNLAH